MTAPGNDKDVEQALATAEQALANAKELRERGHRIADGWRRSRQDNNFRQMLKALIPKAD